MTYGTALLLIAVGAILRFAVTAHTDGFSIQTAGTILMVIGVVGLVIAFLWDAVWARRRAAVVERPVVQRPVVRDPRERL
ncbi:hypothetical protein [Patulibacter sp. SYSU D01012]|uniref:hypothetical protein n=1 Tax=Patulibacter sp. SYSU D01012 TaxID=2817381 RepID=UPI001B31680D|nr:hypothetical protein [Patulibacter sp. SYSU D01012]